MEKKEEIVQYRLTRASETLEDAFSLAQIGRWNSCVNRLYYACFYAVTALLFQHDLSSSKHIGVLSFFNRYYVKTGQVPEHLGDFYNDLFEWRHSGDYEDMFHFQASQVTPWLAQTEEFTECIKQLIQQADA